GILAKLKRRGPMSINALAAELVMDRTTLGRNIRPLERDGLIAVEADASDRRSKALRLSRTGDARLARARQGWSQAQQECETACGRRQAARLRQDLRAVVASGLGPLDDMAAE